LNNSARKGGEPEVLDILRSSPGFQDLWQMHRSAAAGEPLAGRRGASGADGLLLCDRQHGQSGATGDKNAPENFIANPGEPCEARAITVAALYNGVFTVTNAGNNFSRTY
jgi:hypothetical protein